MALAPRRGAVSLGSRLSRPIAVVCAPVAAPACYAERHAQEVQSAVSRLRLSRLAILAALAAAMLGPGARHAFANDKPRETAADPDAWRFRATAYGLTHDGVG